MTSGSFVGRLRSVVLDCPEPRKLAEFYVGLLGAEVTDDQDDTWVVTVDPDGRRLVFQKAPEYKPPHFPDPEASQQIHLDVLVDDIEEAEPKALALGAKLVQANDNDQFRVYADPVGHIFCLMWL
ncbi:VOC family protein [Nocardia iowensis]|uniref:VOC family protein n=1 Tax=Nocardia iowensis TaxID=204891 RepID=A0ABX8RZY2_NOCIO|nr:VOC family protein [Nocardia iowensis]QXN94826.1 VOC family protein [Nocardia iowensis]